MSEQQMEAAPVDVPVDAPSEPVSQSDATASSFEDGFAEAYDEVTEPGYRKPAEFKPEAPPSESGTPDSIRDFEEAEARPVPVAWGQKIAEKWSQLDPEIQEQILEREHQVQKFITERGETLRSAQQSQQHLNQVVERFAPTLPRGQDGKPMPAPALLEHMLAANHALETNPKAALRWLCNSYGINVNDLSETSADPIEEARKQERQALQTELQQVEQQRHAATVQHLTQYVERFISDKPHFAALENEIATYAAGMRSMNPEMDPRDILQAAYDRALAANPEVNPNAKAEAKKKADEAKRVASMNVKSIGGAINRSRGNWMDTMSRVYDEIQTRRS